MECLLVFAMLYVVFAIDALFFCYAVDHIGHDHHAEDHQYNRDGTPREHGA